MMVRTRIFLFAVLSMIGGCLGIGTASADCTDLLNQFNAAIAARSLPDAKAAEAKIGVDASCGNRSVEVKRQRAVLEMLVVQQMRDKNAPVGDYEGLLVEASETLWRGASLLGDIRASQRRFGEASAAYERAIEIMKNVGLTPTKPDEKSVKAVFDQAVASKMLAANEEAKGGGAFVAAAKDHRDGTLGGTMSVSVRGVGIESVPLPIGFETASAKMTPLGEQYANELLKALTEQSPDQVTLVGHTDERGAADYNMGLSDQRVKAVAAFLKKNGITAKITTVAKGKSEPLPPAVTAGRPAEDVWAMSRRVVLQRN
jgi:outer membrane protein OmpA-like peptidoglycan-associated protein